jgi:flagellar basal-body rod protein FlgC
MSHPGRIAGVFSAMEIAGSGLTAERGRMNIVASNLANARTTRTAEGGAYRRLDPVFAAESFDATSTNPVLREARTVSLAQVQEDRSPGQLVYEPGHPDANGQGYVTYPNVNVVTEMVNLMTASRAYEAGVTTLDSLKSMAKAAIKIGQ